VKAEFHAIKYATENDLTYASMIQGLTLYILKDTINIKLNADEVADMLKVLKITDPLKGFIYEQEEK
jgi:hypothetical protein